MAVLTVGVLALQGGFLEHLNLARKAAQLLPPATDDLRRRLAGQDLGDYTAAPPPPTTNGHSSSAGTAFNFIEVRTKEELARCDALIIPGGESTTISLVASRQGLLEPLREFVKVDRKPVWGTCAGLILLAEAADATKKGGQELIGGLDVRVRRNHFGRQINSFVADLDLPFLAEGDGTGALGAAVPFPGVFIRAPVVERVLPHAAPGPQEEEQRPPGEVVAPSRRPGNHAAEAEMSDQVDVLAVLPRQKPAAADANGDGSQDGEAAHIIAVRQGNVFGTSFHPELTDDYRIHRWWLQQVLEAAWRRKQHGIR